VPDPDRPGKFLVCHRNQKTISVGSESAVLDHLDHGDSSGACVGNGERSGKGKGKGQGKGKGKGRG
jgi:hypothetical protein